MQSVVRDKHCVMKLILMTIFFVLTSLSVSGLSFAEEKSHDVYKLYFERQVAASISVLIDSKMGLAMTDDGYHSGLSEVIETETAKISAIGKSCAGFSENRLSCIETLVQQRNRIVTECTKSACPISETQKREVVEIFNRILSESYGVER